MADDHGAVRIAKYDLRTHFDELVYEEQAALKHLLVEQHRAFRLRGHYDKHAQQVGREARPRRVGEIHKRTVDKGFYLVVFLAGDKDVLPFLLHLHAEAAERFGNQPEVGGCRAANGKPVAHHGRHAHERPDFNHVGHNRVGRAVQAARAGNGEQVGGDTADVCAHSVEHAAELLDIGFAGGVVNSGRALGHNGCHDDVGSARHGGLVEQHISAFQLVGGNGIAPSSLIVRELRPEFMQSEEMRVETPAADFVAARLRKQGAAEACRERAEQQDAAA